MSGETLSLIYLTLAKWVTYVGVFTLTGACAARLFVVPRTARRFDLGDSTPDVLHERLRVMALVAAVGTVVAAAARLYAQTYSSFGLDEPVTLDLLKVIAFESRWGGRWMPQVWAAGFAMLAASWVVIQPRAGWWVAAMGVGGLAVTLPMTGHAMAHPSGAAIPWTLQTIHVFAAGLWIGTLGAVILGARRIAAVEHASGNRWVAELVHTFSPVAVGAVGFVIVTGVLTAVLYLDSPSQLWQTGYGRTLLAKTTLVLATGAVGAYNWRRLRPRLGDATGTATLFRSARLELAVAAVLLAVTALLVHLPRPGE